MFSTFPIRFSPSHRCFLKQFSQKTSKKLCRSKLRFYFLLPSQTNENSFTSHLLIHTASILFFLSSKCERIFFVFFQLNFPFEFWAEKIFEKKILCRSKRHCLTKYSVLGCSSDRLCSSLVLILVGCIDQVKSKSKNLYWIRLMSKPEIKSEKMRQIWKLIESSQIGAWRDD